MIIGIALGVLIGMITGAIFVFMLKSLHRASSWGEGLKVVGEMLAVPTFWFGGPWVATKALTSVTWPDVLPSYVVALAVVYTMMAVLPVLRYIARTADDIRGP
jgi:hypothetical protein